MNLDVDINDENLEEHITSAHRKIKVLLIDDQEIIAEGIKRMLTDQTDMELHYLSDPSKAIERATELEPSIILQDLVMPEVDGMTLVRFFRANNFTKDIPIIVLSSKEDPEIKSEAFGNGATDYLVKLPDKVELIARIRAHTRQYMLQLQRDAAFFALREMKKQLEIQNQELERLSTLDGLTGIANRRCFDETLDKEWRRAARDNDNLALLMIDIDYFKPFNDTYGHQGGDDCLKRVATALKNAIHRPADLVARYGGEEFGIILPNTHEEGARTLAERLCSAVQALGIPHEGSKVSETVSISVGLAAMPPKIGMSPQEFIELADKALYQAKEQGRARVIAYSEIEN